MRGKKVIVRIDNDGKIELEAEGYKGQGCQQATEFLSKVLGNTIETTKKAEWWLRNGRQVRKEREQFGIRTERLCG